MSYRAAIILLQNDTLALIERHRAGIHYFTFPGGHVEPGETPAQTAVREAREELGLEVSIQQLLAEIWWRGRPQFYFLAEAVSGDFGTGTGRELHDPPPESGTYHPVWIPLDALAGLPVLPQVLVEMILKARSAGWPEQPLVLNEEK